MKSNYFVVFLFGLLMFAGLSSAIAFDYRMVKWTMCDSYNLTKYDCDIFWEVDTNPYYVGSSSNLEDYYNKSELNKKLNSYYNETEFNDILEDYYNKTQIIVLVSSNLNETELEDLSFYNSSEVDELINSLKKEWLINMTGNFVEKDDYDHDNTGNSGISDNTILIVLGVAGAGIVAFLFFNKKQSGGQRYQGDYGNLGRSVQPRIKSRNSQEVEQIKKAVDPQEYKEENNGGNN